MIFQASDLVLVVTLTGRCPRAARSTCARDLAQLERAFGLNAGWSKSNIQMLAKVISFAKIEAGP